MNDLEADFKKAFDQIKNERREIIYLHSPICEALKTNDESDCTCIPMWTTVVKDKDESN